MNPAVPVETIEQKIYLIRGHKVILDQDLAEMYGVEVKRLNEQVRRNFKRFPADFMFELTYQEFMSLKPHFATSSSAHGGRRKAPLVFTEQGVAMLSGILNSDRAIEVNILIMRAFVKLREMIASNKELAGKLAGLEKKYDAQFKVVFDAIRQMMTSPATGKKRIGFQAEE
jgi:ORF6N domain